MNSESQNTNILNVALSVVKPDNTWGPDNILSFQASQAIIHINQQKNKTKDTELSKLLTIQQAARKLVSLNPVAFKLIGDWDFESQWHFWQGVYTPKKTLTIEFAPLPEEQEQRLSSMIQCYSWCKDLINESPENLSPQALANKTAQFLKEIAPAHVAIRSIEGEALREAGLVGIYNVGRGSERPPVLLEVDYNPLGQDEPVSIALVGKGITFDSGGYSLKPTVGMLHMKSDMGGAGTIAGALAFAMTQGLKKRVKLFLCCAENLVSGHAYKLSDVLTYKNGVSVEIVNTDAEGRVVLADGLILAGETNAHTIIDAATLTGAACVALGDHYNALFTMDDQLAQELDTIGSNHYDPMWRLPLENFHQDNCPSDYATTANSKPQPGGGIGGASNAAGFLSRFVDVENKKWAHLDLAACFKGSGDALFSAGATGRGIRSIASFLLEQ